MRRNLAKDANATAKREMHEAVDKVIDEKKKMPIGTREAEKDVAVDLNEAAHRDTQSARHTQEAETTMHTKPQSGAGSKAPRSRKGLADVGAEKRFRSQAKADRDRQRQQEHDRPDRGGPQGRKDKDFQRKF